MGFTNGLAVNDQWGAIPYTLVTDDDVVGSTKFYLGNLWFNLAKIKHEGHSKQE